MENHIFTSNKRKREQTNEGVESKNLFILVSEGPTEAPKSIKVVKEEINIEDEEKKEGNIFFTKN
jgi:hypothetical protein